MPKAGSGFIGQAQRSAARMLSGAGGAWRIGSTGDFYGYQQEITDIYKSLYRRTEIVRDSRGGVKSWRMNRKTMNDISQRVNNLSQRIADNLELYNHTAAQEYATLREQAKGIHIDQQTRSEVRDSLRNGERMLVRTTGRSDAGSRASESGYRTSEANNTNIIRQINSNLNAARSNIWYSVHQEGPGASQYYARDVANAIMDRYKRVESAARKRRKT